jgi:hypothetical protein
MAKTTKILEGKYDRILKDKEDRNHKGEDMEEKNRRRGINGYVKRCYSSSLYPFIKLAYGQIYNDDITVCSPPWLLSS